jgi:hypothetical protein
LTPNYTEPIVFGIFSDLRRGCTIRRILGPTGLHGEPRCGREF